MTGLAMATSDNVGLASLVVSVLLLIGGAVLQYRLRGFEALKTKVEQLETSVVDAAAKLVDERLGSIRTEQHRVDKRLEDGEKQFAALQQSDHRLQLQLLNELRTLNEKLDQRFADKVDLGKIESRVERHEERIARIETKVEARS